VASNLTGKSSSSLSQYRHPLNRMSEWDTQNAIVKGVGAAAEHYFSQCSFWVLLYRRAPLIQPVGFLQKRLDIKS
jgi:hypothetical protein